MKGAKKQQNPLKESNAKRGNNIFGCNLQTTWDWVAWKEKLASSRVSLPPPLFSPDQNLNFHLGAASFIILTISTKDQLERSKLRCRIVLQSCNLWEQTLRQKLRQKPLCCEHQILPPSSRIHLLFSSPSSLKISFILTDLPSAEAFQWSDYDDKSWPVDLEVKNLRSRWHRPRKSSSLFLS